MKSPLLTALIIVIAASVSRGEDSVTQKIAEAVAPLPTALRDGAEVFTYDSIGRERCCRREQTAFAVMPPIVRAWLPSFVHSVFTGAGRLQWSG